MMVLWSSSSSGNGGTAAATAIQPTSSSFPIPQLLELDSALAREMKAPHGSFSFKKGEAHSDWKLLNDPSNEKVKVTVFTADDKKELRRHPEKRTQNIIQMLSKMKKFHVDPTVKDIAQAKHVLSLYSVLKKNLKSAITHLGGETPPLPSEEGAVTVDAAGVEWGKARMKGGMAKLLHDRELDINRERRQMAYEDGKMKPAKNMTKRGYTPTNSRILGSALPNQMPNKHHPSRHTQPFCMPPGCNICIPPACTHHSAPPAPYGVPQGLGAASPHAPHITSHLVPEKGAATNLDAINRRMLATPQCPCGCPVAKCPCRCSGASLFAGGHTTPELHHKVAKIAIVHSLPPVSADEGKPVSPSAHAAASASHPIQPHMKSSHASADCHPPLCRTG